MSMRAHLSKPVLGAVMALLAACSNPVNVRADYDRSVDFSGYRTWAFYAPLAIDKAGYSSLNAERMKTAVQNEMQARGYAYSEQSPDLLVNINANIADQTRVTTVSQPVMVGGWYGYRGGFYSAWPAYTNQTYVDQYKQGTVNVDIVDAGRRKLVWEGVAVARVGKKAMEDPGTAIRTVMGEIYAQYPFRAGGAAP